MKRSNSSQSSFYQVGAKALALFVSFVLITTMILPTTLVFADERQRDTSQEQSQSYSSAHSYNHADTPDGSHDGVSNQNESTVTGIDQNDTEKSGDSKPSGTSSGSNAGGSAPDTTGGDTATGSDDSLTNTMGDIQTASDVTNLLSASSVAPSSNDANNTAQANNNDTAQLLADDANCYCAYTCEDGLVRQDCPVCKFDASKCKGTHKRVCSCEVACVPDATGKCASADGCPVCEIDPTRCIATEPAQCICAEFNKICRPDAPWDAGIFKDDVSTCAVCRADPSKCEGDPASAAEGYCICFADNYKCSGTPDPLCPVCVNDMSVCRGENPRPTDWTPREPYGSNFPQRLHDWFESDREGPGPQYWYNYTLDINKVLWMAEVNHYEEVTDHFWVLAYARTSGGWEYARYYWGKVSYGSNVGWYYEGMEYRTAFQLSEYFGTGIPGPGYDLTTTPVQDEYDFDDSDMAQWLAENPYATTYDPVTGPFIDGTFPWDSGDVPEPNPNPEPVVPTPNPDDGEGANASNNDAAAPTPTNSEEEEEEEEVDKSRLQQLLADVAEDMTSPEFGTLDEYTEETRYPFVDTIKNGHAVNRDPEATQAQVDNAYNTLYTTWQNLEREDADKEKLQALVTIANGKLFTNGTDYEWKYYDGVWFTEESTTQLSNLAAAAQAVINKDDAKEEELEAAYDALLNQLCYGMEKNPNYGNELEQVPTLEEMLPVLQELSGSMLGGLDKGLIKACEMIRDSIAEEYKSVTSLSDAIKSAINVAKKAASATDDPYGRENASNTLELLEEVYGWVNGLNKQQKEQFIFKNSQTRRHGAWSQTAALLEKAGIEPGLESADIIYRLVYDVNYAGYS